MRNSFEIIRKMRQVNAWTHETAPLPDDGGGERVFGMKTGAEATSDVLDETESDGVGDLY
jgi:hypothetical protein